MSITAVIIYTRVREPVENWWGAVPITENWNKSKLYKPERLEIRETGRDSVMAICEVKIRYVGLSVWA